MTNRVLGKAPCRKCAAAEISKIAGSLRGAVFEARTRQGRRGIKRVYVA